MIVRPLDGGIGVIAQHQHAHQCWQMAKRWAEDVPAGLLLAARQHDNGWRQWDARPRLDPATHQPHRFFATPVSQHVALYRRGIRNAVAMDPLCGLLVSMHGCGLYNGRYGVVAGYSPKPLSEADQPRASAFLAEQAALQAGLTKQLGIADAEAMRLYTLLQLWDVLSLACLSREHRAETVQAGPWTLALQPAGPLTLSVAPWPFVGGAFATTTPYKVIASQQYATTGEAARALWSARTKDLVVNLQPG